MPEQGRSLATRVRSRAGSWRHGATASSARTWRPGCLILQVGCGYSPAQVATADRIAFAECTAVVTARHSPG